MTSNAGQSGERIYEMLWDCKFCDSKKLLGKTHRFCPNCGAAQDASWRYFPSDAEKVAVQDHVYVGADRVCPACSSLSSGSAQFCGACGSPIDQAPAVQTLGERVKASGDQFVTEDLDARRQREMMAAASGVPLTASTAKKGLKRWQLIALGVVGLVVVGILASIFWTREVTGVVMDYRWERDIRVEEYKPTSGKSSCGSEPGDAYNIDRRYEQVGSKQVPDGQECRTVQKDRGNGTFSERQECSTKYRSEPVYGYVCYYTVNRWGYTRTAHAQGDKNTAPEWPNANLRTGTCLGCEREQGRDEQYYLIFQRSDKDERFECPVPFNTWSETSIEKSFTLQVGAVLDDERCDTLKPR